MSQPAVQKFENNVSFKQIYTIKLFIAFKMAYSWCFSLGGNLDFPELLQKRFMTPNTDQLALTRFGVHTECKQNAYISHDRTPSENSGTLNLLLKWSMVHWHMEKSFIIWTNTTNLFNKECVYFWLWKPFREKAAFSLYDCFQTLLNNLRKWLYVGWNISTLFQST